ncbi:Na+/H+ antiporter NhaC family protein [Oceanispirochaeta sp.]|jgi:Na+/H+ antiporter NhaC|uniref:Na+/H+ antiporter NhaC family protein n=1 Tax=Oceanispirochaeta sp. TaxID=2035350 RepID=UPI00263A3396|nr:Na+/H+ antiporter NhaC family protein [Oceanispirochaeta sp.]MDA3958936.1 Na+/H+ antiporter NhaC family protein [Oceanispirochaeta sp.]
MEAENLKFRGGWGMAFIPLAVFFIFCVLLFLVFLSYDMHALAMGGFIGLLIGGMFVKNYGEYWKSVISGIASPNSITIVVILFVIGMFSQMLKDSNASEGFIWIASRVHLTGGPFVAFVFFSCCLISTATGSSIGTMFAAFPVFFGAGAVLGANPAMLAGAITSGCIFGDNLAPISDTTIASASTQLFRNGEAADIAGVVTSRFKYSLVAGLISIILFAILGGGGEVASDVESMGDPLRLVMLIPVVGLLITAVKSRDLFKAITVGLLLGIVSGLISGIFTFPSLFSSSGELGNSVTGFLPTGVASMMSTVTLVISVFGIMGVLHAAGAIDRLVNAILKSRFVKSDRGTELAITIGSCVTCMIFGGVTSAAILTFGPVVNELGMKKGLHPYRRANLLDGFVNTIPVVIPFLSVFVFITVALSGLDPLSVSKSMLYPLVLFVVLLFSVITGWGRMHEIQVAEIS